MTIARLVLDYINALIWPTALVVLGWYAVRALEAYVKNRYSEDGDD